MGNGNLPPLPMGYKIEEPENEGTPPLPKGYSIEQSVKKKGESVPSNFGSLAGKYGYTSEEKQQKPIDPTEFAKEYNRNFEQFTGHKELELGSSLPQIAKQREQRKYLKNRAIEETEFKPLLNNVQTGTTSPQQLASLYTKPYGKKIVQDVVEEVMPGASQYGLDPEVFGNEEKWNTIAQNINVKNRPQGVEAQNQYYYNLDNEIYNDLDQLELGNVSVSGGTGGGAANVSSFKLSGVNTNSPEEIGAAISQIESADFVKGKDGQKVEKEPLLKKLNEKLFYLSSQKEIHPDIYALTDKAKEAITRVNMQRERGESISPEEFAKNDQLNQEHFQLGLNFIKDAKPGMYANVTRGLNERGVVSDLDFEQIAGIGQEIYNQKIFREGAVNPEAIGKESSLDYQTYQSKKANYAAILSEEIKRLGYKNRAKVPQSAIDKAVARHPELTNVEIINDIRKDEANGGYGVTKGGLLNSFFRGMASPIKGINQTYNALTESPVDNYLNSRRLDYGDQVIPDRKGNYRDVLPSERGNIFNEISEGFGQFITQVGLSKGMGKIIQAPYSAAAGSVPRAAMTGAQASNVAAYPGTFLTTAIQTYGSAYTDLLNKTGDPNTAKLGATVNTIGQSAIEAFIMPDVKIADKAKGLLADARAKFADDIVSLVKKGEGKEAAKSVVRNFAENSAKIMGGNITEENLQQLTDYTTEALFSPSTIKDRNLGNELWETTKGTVLQMAIPTLLGAGGQSKQQQKFGKDALNTGAINFDEYKDALGKSLINGEIDQQKHDEAIQILGLHKESINNAPKRDAKGEVVSEERQLEYAYQNTVAEVNAQLAANQKDPVQREPFEKKIQEADAVKRKIYYGEEIKGLPKEEEVVLDTDEDDNLLTRITSSENVGTDEKREGLQYFIDKVGEAPIASQRFGEGVVEQLLPRVPTAKLEENYKFLAEIDPEGQDADAIAKELDRRANEANPPIDQIRELDMGSEPLMGEENIVLIDKTKDVLDDVTDEKVGEEKYQSFSIKFNDGGRAFGDIRNGVAHIIGIDAAKKEGSATEAKRGTGVYKRLIEKLSNIGIGTIKVDKPSADSRIVLEGLVRKGILENPRDFTGISIDEQPTKFDISKKQNFEIVKTKEASNEEPVLPEGETIVTYSGMTESERQRRVAERQGKSGLTEEQSLENELADLAYKAAKLTYSSKAQAESNLRQRIRAENAKAGYEKYRYDSDHVKKRVTKRKGRLKGKSVWRKVSSVNTDIGNQSINEQGVILRDRGTDLQNNFEDLVEVAPYLEVEDANGRKMSKDQIDLSLQDIFDGIPSVQAENLLNVMEDALDKDDFPVRDNFAGERIRLNDLLGVKSEIIGEPLTEDAIKDWLNDEANLTPEQEEMLNSELQNILYEYENEREIELPISEFKQGAKEASSTKAEPKTTAIETKKQINESTQEATKATESKPTEKISEPKSPTTEDSGGAKEIAKKIRSLKVDLSKMGDGGLQSNPLGLPVAVWNGAMDIIATTVEAGGKVADAIKRGLNYIQKNHRGQWDKKGFNDQVMKELGVRGITVNGEDLVVKDVDKEFAETINGFYSDIEQSVLNVSPNDKGLPQAWLKKIGSGDEAKWTGVADWLNSLPKDQKVSRQEVLQWMKDNRIQVVEVVKSEDNKIASESEILDAVYSNDWVDLGNGVRAKGDVGGFSVVEINGNKQRLSRVEAENLINKELSTKDKSTKFPNYQLEGKKENYKEVLVTMPKNDAAELSKIQDGFSKKFFDKTYSELTSEEKKTIDYQTKSWVADHPTKGTFKSSHFDEPNILVHLRMNTRTDSDGNRVLFLEEIQSDWGQKGKKEGFKQELVAKKSEDGRGFVVYTKEGKRVNHFPNAKTAEDAIEYTKEDTSDNSAFNTPTAPFVTETPSWTKLALKVALKEAVKQNASVVAWTTGEQQNERYDLSKQVDEIGWQKNENGTYNITPKKDGSVVGTRDMMANLTLKQVEDYVGKDIAEKIQNDEGKVWEGGNVKQGKLTGQQLKVGGKGMKGFYGSPSEGTLGIVGNVAKSLFKQEPKTVSIEGKKNLKNEERIKYLQHFVDELPQLEKTVFENKLSFTEQELDNAIENGSITNESYKQGIRQLKKYEESVAKYNEYKERLDEYNKLKFGTTQHSIDITPELKQEAESGLPLFKDIKGRGKEIADLLRKGKIKASGLQSNIAGIPAALWNAVIDTIATAIEGGATLAQAIQKAIRDHKLNSQKGFDQKEFISKLENATGEKLTQDAAKEPPKTPTEGKGVGDEGGEIRERRFSKQVISDENILPQVKKGVESAMEYVEQTNAMSIAEAAEIIDRVGVDEAYNLVVSHNNVKGAVRVVLGQVLIKKYNQLAKEFQDKGDTEKSNYYINKSIDVANYASERFGTEAGQMIQAFSLFSSLTPEAQVRAAAKDVKKQYDKKSKKRKPDIDDLGEKMQKANEEATDELLKSKKITESAAKAQKSSVQKAKEKVKKAQDKRKKLLDKYKGNKGGGLTLSSGGLTKEGLEYVGELVKTYIDEGIANIQVISANVVQHLKDVGAKVNDAVERNISDIISEQVERSNNLKIVKGLADLEKEIGKIIRSHYTVPVVQGESLKQKFINQIGLDGKDAEELAAEIQKEFDAIATRKKQDILFKERAKIDKIQHDLERGKPKSRKEVQDDIVKYSNLGAFSQDDFFDFLSKKLNLGKLTVEEAKEIERLAQKIEKAPEGSPKNDATQDLLKYRANMKGVSGMEMAQAVWYANILSGHKTHIVNVVSTFFNGAAFFASEAIRSPRSIPVLMYGAARGLRRGGFEAWHTLKTGRSPIHISKIETPSTLERIRFIGGWFNPGNYLKFVGRLMQAEDVLQFQALKEMRATQLAYKEARALGEKNPFGRKTWKIVEQKLLNTKERSDDAKEQAQMEGLKPNSVEWKRRVYELMEMNRDIQMTEEAYGFAAEGTFNHAPEGTLGAITNGVSSLLDMTIGGTRPLRFFVPFTKIITNVVNNALNFTPVGFIRAARGQRGFESFDRGIFKGAYKELTPEQKKQLIAKASLGVALTGGIYALTKIPCKDGHNILEITGGGTGDFGKDAQLKESGWQPYSIRVCGGSYISYKSTPLVFNLAYLGYMNDNEKYGKDSEATMWRKISGSAYQTAQLALDGTWVGSTSDLMGTIASSTPSQLAGNVEKTIGKMAAQTLVPNWYLQGAQQTEEWLSLNQKDARGQFNRIKQHIPVVRNSMNDKLNALGEPIKTDVDIFISENKPHKVWDYLNERNVFVSTINPNTFIIYDADTNEERVATQDEFYAFSKLRGEKIREGVEKLIGSEDVAVMDGDKIVRKKGVDLNASEVKEKMKGIVSSATVEAKDELFKPMPTNYQKKIQESLLKTYEDIEKLKK